MQVKNVSFDINITSTICFLNEKLWCHFSSCSILCFQKLYFYTYVTLKNTV